MCLLEHFLRPHPNQLAFHQLQVQAQQVLQVHEAYHHDHPELGQLGGVLLYRHEHHELELQEDVLLYHDQHELELQEDVLLYHDQHELELQEDVLLYRHEHHELEQVLLFHVRLGALLQKCILIYSYIHKKCHQFFTIMRKSEKKTQWANS